MKKIVEELVLNFLEERCPIKRVRLTKNKKFTKALVIMSGIINGERNIKIPYNDNPTQKDIMLRLIIQVIEIVFGFNIDDRIYLAKKYLNY